MTKLSGEARLKKYLSSRTDFEAQRIRRYLAMPDLSRTPGSPIYELVKKIVEIPELKDFDQIEAPEIVPVDVSFDYFNFAANHPARSKSDTYYIDEKNILRTHTTVMWYYYLLDEKTKSKIKKNLPLGLISYGKVYRKDEIDRHHMNIFHQMDGLYLHPTSDRNIKLDDLENILGQIAKAIFGPEIKYRFNKDQFPYTNPSLEMEIEINGKWIEVVGSGLVRPVVLEKLGVAPKQYTGWAFGFGLERLAIIGMELPDIRLLWSEDPRVKKQFKLGQKYREISKYPPITRDISFVVGKDFVPNNYFDLIREITGDLAEQVELLDKYEDPKKFGPDKVSYTYRVVYRSPQRTLTTAEVEPLQNMLYERTKTQFNAVLR